MKLDPHDIALPGLADWVQVRVGLGIAILQAFEFGLWCRWSDAFGFLRGILLRPGLNKGTTTTMPNKGRVRHREKSVLPHLAFAAECLEKTGAVGATSHHYISGVG